MGMLDFLNTPQGVGLLSGVASYAMNARRGTPINNIGRGLAGGLLGYQQANELQKAEAEKQKRAQLMRDAFQAGNVTTTMPGQQVQVPMARLGSNMFANPQDAQDFAATNKTINEMMASPASPSSVGPAQTFALPQKQPPSRTPIGPRVPDESDLMAQVYAEAASPMQKTQDGYARDMLVATAPPMPQEAEQVTQDAYSFTTPEQTRTDFDPRKAAMALMNSGDPEYMMMGFEMLSKTPASEKPQLVEVFDDASGRMVKKWMMPGEADGVMAGYGKPEDVKPMQREDVHIGGSQWQTMEFNPQTRQFDKPIGKPFTKKPTASEVNVRQDGARIYNEAEKKLGAGMGDYAIELRKNADSAYRVADEVNYVVDALQGYGGGPLTEAKAYVGKFAPDSEWGKLASVGELATTIQAKLAPSMRAAGSGATSDFEMKMWMKAVPTLATTETGRELIRKYTNRVAERAAARADIEAQLIDERGRVDYAEVHRRMKAKFGDSFFDQADRAKMGGKPAALPTKSQGGYSDPEKERRYQEWKRSQGK